jgi:hypothetical protein
MSTLLTSHLSIHARVFTQVLTVKCEELGIDCCVEHEPSCASAVPYITLTGTGQMRYHDMPVTNATTTLTYTRAAQRSVAEVAYEAGRNGLEMLTISCDGEATSYVYSGAKGLARCFGDASKLAKLTRVLTVASEAAVAEDEEKRQEMHAKIADGALYRVSEADKALQLEPIGFHYAYEEMARRNMAGKLVAKVTAKVRRLAKAAMSR